MTYFELDMAAALSEPVAKTADGSLPEEQERRLQRLHDETMPALQLFLLKAEISPGEYPSSEKASAQRRFRRARIAKRRGRGHDPDRRNLPGTRRG